MSDKAMSSFSPNLKTNEMDSNSSSRRKIDNRDRNKDVVKNVLKTIFLVLSWVCLGLMVEVTGPTLIDLKTRTNSNYEEIATALAGLSVGFFIGSVLGGLLVDKFGLYCELMMALSLEGSALATIGIPWVPKTEVIWVLTCIEGTCIGVQNTAGMKLIFNIWLEKAASPMHILHCGFGIGSFIIPLIANPFLAVPAPMDGVNTTLNITTLPLNDSLTSYFEYGLTTSDQNGIKYTRPSRIEYAYLIPGAITICLSLVFHAYHLNGSKERNIQKEIKQKTQKKVNANSSLKLKQMLNPATCAKGDTVYGLQIFVLLFLYYVNCEGGEKTAGTFIRAFSIDHFGFSVDDGSYINTTFWISFAVGRFAGFVAARWIPIRILILIESGGILVSAICIALLGGNSAVALWITIQPIGFFTGPFFPSGYGWGNYHVHMTGSGIAVLQLGAAIGALVYMKLVGFLYDTYGPRVFLFTLLGYSIAMCVISILLDVIGARHSKRGLINANKETEQAREDAIVEIQILNERKL